MDYMTEQVVKSLKDNNQVIIVIDFNTNQINMHGALLKNKDKITSLDWQHMFHIMIIKKMVEESTNENKKD